ncbi:hypothetical protein BOX15_Mlig020078g13, partial [Macrostomum lignano]
LAQIAHFAIQRTSRQTRQAMAQTQISKFFKTMPKDGEKSSSSKQDADQTSTPDQERKDEKVESRSNWLQNQQESRKSMDKRPLSADKDEDKDCSGEMKNSEPKRPCLSTETPPRPQQNLNAFLASPSSFGKENQSQFLSAQPAAVQSLVVDFGISWMQALKPELTKTYFVQLAEFVRAERSSKTIYPPPGEVFSWTRACRLQEVKVVILGQDPYHGPNQAHGLCFSVRRPTVPPPSLLNIYKEVSNNFPDKFQHPGHGDLTGWAEQGVLLLNAVLTVRRGEANSHQGRGWETFTDAVVATLNSRCAGLVFILWGNYAQKKGAKIDKRKHKVICGAHPSPLAVNRGGFFGKMYFKEANDYLKSVGKSTIDWCHLP